MAQASAPCKGCGADIPRTNPTAPIRHYCSPDCRPRCSVDDCDKPRHGNVYCSAHHTRWKRLGDPLAPQVRVSNRAPRSRKTDPIVVLLCVVAGCGQPRRKRGWCASHYAQWWSTGEVRPFKYKWAALDLVCIACGAPTGTTRGKRKFCSAACNQLWVRYEGQIPTLVSCVGCGADIDLVTSGKNGRRRKSDVKLCRRCRQDKRKHGVSVTFLADRDGTICGICGTDVDMTLRYPDPGTPSVDHVIPRACGGTNDPSNLALAHLWCNQVKSDRI